MGEIPERALAHMASGLSREFGAPCEYLPPEPDPVFAFNPARQQFYSTEILAALAKRELPFRTRLLAVTPVDLYIPILTFVFGEAQLRGSCALVSLHRLRQEYYGLPADPEILSARLLKEAVHELGHTLSLTHCDDYQCVMSASHGVEWIDLKRETLCSNCRSYLSGLAAVRHAG